MNRLNMGLDQAGVGWWSMYSGSREQINWSAFSNDQVIEN